MIGIFIKVREDRRRMNNRISDTSRPEWRNQGSSYVVRERDIESMRLWRSPRYDPFTNTYNAARSWAIACGISDHGDRHWVSKALQDKYFNLFRNSNAARGFKLIIVLSGGDVLSLRGRNGHQNLNSFINTYRARSWVNSSVIRLGYIEFKRHCSTLSYSPITNT